jgi:hypothetical protein
VAALFDECTEAGILTFANKDGRSMSARIEAVPEHKAVAASSPGHALARHFRVQYREPTQSFWKRYAACQRHEQAEHCRAELERRGYRARLISYQICPVAS